MISERGHSKWFGRFIVGLIVGLLFAGTVQAKNMFDWRMVILTTLDYRNVAQMKSVEEFMPRMKAAGYNGMFMDSFLNPKLEKQSATTKANLQKLISVANQNGISIIPMSQSQLGNAYVDKSLSEAFPCRDTRFVVNNGVALPKGDSSVSIINGDFEDGLAGWRRTAHFKIDNAVKRSGGASMRCDDPKANYVRLSRQVQVKPYTTYELAMWVKTQNIVSHTTRYGDQKCRDIGFVVQSPGTNYIYQDRYFRNNLKANNNWKLVKTAFHSLDRTSVLVSVQATKILQYTGKVWFDDVTITEVGLQGTIVRPGLEVKVKTTTGTRLVEGKDYVVGSKKLTIPSGSAAKNGDELLVDWYKEANVVAPTANPAMCSDVFWGTVRQEIVLQDNWFGTPPARLMKYSEWRMGGWDPICNQMYQIDKLGSGRYMDAVANITKDYYKEVNGSRLSILFNDAYDPFHNSTNPHYLIRGGCIGSGYGLDEDIIILNWNVANRTESMKFFAGTEGKSRPGWGIKTSRQRQIISSGPGQWKDWIPKMTALEGQGKLKDGDVIGIAYHTYKAFPDYYQKIEEFASGCKAAGRWATGPISFPEKTPGIPVAVKQNRGRSMKNKLSCIAVRGWASKALSLQFSIPENQGVRLTVHNLRGQEVSRILDEQMTAGTYDRKIDASKIAPGVYFATLLVAGEMASRITKKIVVF